MDPAKVRPHRISVVGSTGSGKTHLARRLSETLDLPVYELDALRRDANGRELPSEDFATVVATVAESADWIIDGHYRDVRFLVWKRAETVVWLNYPLSLIATQLLRRFRQNKRMRRTHGEAMRETQTRSTAQWTQRLRRVMRTLRERDEYRRLLAGDDFKHAEVVELNSPQAAEKWLSRYNRR
jgi:adenylate kinase family enzyme